MIEEMDMLAQGLEPGIWLGIVSIVVNVGVVIFLARQNNVISQLNRSEDRRIADAANAEKRFNDTAERLVQERFNSMSTTLRGHVATFTATLEQATARLGAAENKIASLGGIGPEAKMQMTQEVSELKDYIRENSATKDEVIELKRAVQELTQSVNKVERENLSRHEMKQLLEEVMKNK